MKTLESYVLGRWQAGEGATRTLIDPSTEEPLAQCGTGGIDFGAVLDHARAVGGPALRALGFRARGAALKALSGAIYEHRDELLDLSMACAGTTRGDAKFDVDGATGTLAAYAHFAKELNEGGHLADGEGTQLGRTARYWGQHILTPKQGVAVHVNAFNFPAWNMAEKMACALVAGMPVIEKPGTPTAMLAWRIAQIVVASEILPEGSFQFLCGSTGDLIDRMGPQDVLAFTGSSGTGALLRGNESLVKHNAHVNVEADSLNAAILAPDVEEGDETYGLFLANVELDMTQKTGQKCTAVRRVLVPESRIDDVARDLAASLGRVQVGDPREKGVRMGPLASADALESVRSGIAALAATGDVVCGGADAVQEKGFFVAPTLIRARDAEADAIHALEVFGPVATLVPYSGSAEEAVRLANRGGGGLVASLYSNDRAWTEEVVLGIGPWHGRVWIASDKVAEQALPPGMVLPASVHGGPGRAGGGQELGGLRGLEPYLQRTAVQGFQGFVASAFGPVETS
jgi:oxepin-CoA hydrolase/3-oxo-5,6-dehydrosuberyl-CoA semialdehyde dehydrogenase